MEPTKAQAIRALRVTRIWAENFILSALEKLTRWKFTAADPPREILLFRNCFIGDFIVCFPALDALRRQHPSARIIFLNTGSANPELRDAKINTDVHSLANNWIDEFVTEKFLHSDIAGWLKSVREKIAQCDPDVAAVFLYSEEAFASKLKKLFFLRLAGIHCRIIGIDSAVATSWLTVDAIKFCGHTPANQVEAAWQSIKPLLGHNARLSRQYPPFSADEDISQFALTKPYVVVSPGTKLVTFNGWPIEKYMELCRQLTNQSAGLNVYVIGGPQDAAYCQEIASSIASSRVSSLAGHLSLAQTATLLSHAKAYLGADSGPMHLAAYAGCPIVAIFSSYQPVSYWAPWSDHFKVIRNSLGCDDCRLTHGYCYRGNYPCIRQIEVGAVLYALDGLIKLF